MLSATPLEGAYALGVVTWPLLAGLSVVLWSKVRSAAPAPVAVRPRRTIRR